MKLSYSIVRSITVACLSLVVGTSSSCEGPQNNTEEALALLAALVANGIVVIDPGRGQCTDSEGGNCPGQEGD